MSVLYTKNTKVTTKRTCFFDESVDVARYDKVRYPIFDKLTQKQLSFFWRPEEVDITPDSNDFKHALSNHEQHIFTSNLGRQIILDSVQGRAPSMAFLSICSLPELENWIQTWAFSETIHSRSYTHIIRNIYSDPSKVFDKLLDVPEIVDCAKDISKYYDHLIDMNNIKHCQMLTTANRVWNTEDDYNHKRALWLCLNAVNALEGIRFYVSFACSWAFAEAKKMEGNAKIIKFIARDENLHLASTQHLLKILPKEDKDFLKIQEECKEEVLSIFEDVIKQEKLWAEYLFRDGSTLGLNQEILCEYIDFIAQKRMASVGFGTAPRINPLPWTQKWISGGDVQPAPQQTQITSYLVGDIKQDVKKDNFKGFKL